MFLGTPVPEISRFGFDPRPQDGTLLRILHPMGKDRHEQVTQIRLLGFS